MYFYLKNKLYFLVLVFFTSYASIIHSQTISRPNVTDACFVNSNELQEVTATISGVTIPSGTEFILRLSNKQGGFATNSIVIAQTQNSNNNIVFSNFSYPTIDGEGTTLGSDGYRIRVEQLDGDLQSSRSSEFSAYFYDGTLLQLNPRVLCEFGELRAVPDNLPEYVWHRVTNTGGDQIIAGESGSTIQANVEGDYYFTPPLGNCSGFIPEARSNLVTVFEASQTDVPNFNISIQTGVTPMCAAESITLTSDFTDTNGFTYQWIKDDRIVDGETNPSITITGIDAEGDYFLEISDDTQRSRLRCSKQSANQIFVDLKNPLIRFADDQPLVIADIPGQNETLNVLATGEEPITIQWFKDGVAIPNSNTAQLDSTGPGEYTAQVTGSSCAINQSSTTNSVQVIAIDNLEISINYNNPSYTDCTEESIGIVIESVTTEVNSSPINLNPNSFPPREISWLNNGELITDLAGPNIILNSPSRNGNYSAQITLGNNVFFSNTLSVKLNPGQLQIEASELIINEDNPVATLSVLLEPGADESLFSYRWFREGINNQETLSTNSTLEVNTGGSYNVEVTFDDCPTVTLNAINITAASSVIPNIITPNGFNNRRWELPARFTGQPNINVQIISSSGVEVLNVNNYDGNWPRGADLKESVYYYIISDNNSPLEKGSITIIR